MLAIETIREAHCNKCLGKRKHALLFEHVEHWSDEDEDPTYSVSGEDQYEILKCRGCDTICIRKVATCSAYPETEIAYYPPAVSRDHPPWFNDFQFSHVLSLEQSIGQTPKLLHSAIITNLLREIYVALHNNARSLAAMGVRAVIDALLTDKVGNDGTFEQRLDRLSTDGFISVVQRDALSATIDSGHASAHRGFQIDLKNLNAIIDITEGLIWTIYVSPGEAKLLADATPKREPRKRSAG